MGVLNIYLDKVTDLVDSDGLGKSDPYVTFYLEKDKLLFDKGFGKQTSSKKRNTLNPVYGETFAFSQVDSMKNMVLYIKILDDDTGLDDRLGKATVQLEDLNLSETPKEVEVTAEGKRKSKAKIYLKLSFTK
jgi:Ca2+-dependent lipid-binding protein